MDRQVLRFHGYFKESCVETSLEAYRVRKINLFFYLEDDTIEITEKKQMNSGIPQGAFLKRQKVLRPDNSGFFFGIQDFQIGREIEFFGKNIRFTSCDEYTREFYENINMPQPPAEDIETDNWEK